MPFGATNGMEQWALGSVGCHTVEDTTLERWATPIGSMMMTTIGDDDGEETTFNWRGGARGRRIK